MITMICHGATDTNVRTSLSCLLLIVGSSLVGLIDDVYGSHVSRGLRGHVKTLLRDRRITTGMQKAVVIWLLAAVSITMSANVHGLATLIFDATLISLAANFINLLDLRPGRSVKAFLIIFVSLMAFDCRSPAAPVPVGLAGAALAGLSDELREQCMMGDAGANPLGAALGYWVAVSLPLHTKAFVLLSLISVHIYTERHSLSKAIDKNPVLRFIDRLGRSQQP
jgi:UDP-GlcNAc:undecaprenyl-phosphate GlcNAc-1-phosphate transferase